MMKKKTVTPLEIGKGGFLILETPHLLGGLGQAVVSWGSAYHLVEKRSRSGLPRISEGTNKRENETITLESELKPAELLERQALGVIEHPDFC